LVKDGFEMTESHTDNYHANFRLDPSGQWLAELEEIPEVHTYGRTLGKAREYLVDALALWLDTDPDSVKDRIEFRTPDLPRQVLETVETALAEREIAEVVSRVVADLMSAASVALVEDAHLSMRDAAEILGLSHQRVQQLVAAARPHSPDRGVIVKDARRLLGDLLSREEHAAFVKSLADDPDLATT
jgi:predicted RNase H-like HicB family nuclease